MDTQSKNLKGKTEQNNIMISKDIHEKFKIMSNKTGIKLKMLYKKAAIEFLERETEKKDNNSVIYVK